MKSRRCLFIACTLAILAVAAGFRLPRLDSRPMHCDEANQAVRAGILRQTGKYQYDATDHHGPSLYWLTLPSLALSGAQSFAETGEWSYRLVPVLFGLGLIGLLPLLADGLGRGAVLAAALLTAVSAPLVFYSRYYIQETLLVFFTYGLIGSAWRYVQTRKLLWALAAGVCLGMMHCTKETWVLSAAALAAALVLTLFLSRCRLTGSLCSSSVLPLLVVAISAVLVAVALYSGFGKSWDGPGKSLLAFGNYWRRGREAVEHFEPWYYYLQILFAYRPARGFFFTEGFVGVLAIVGAVAGFLPPSRLALPGRDPPPQGGDGTSRLLLQFLAFFTFALLVLYCLIPYKTPWCVLSFFQGLILLAGAGAQAFVRWLNKLMSRATESTVVRRLAVVGACLLLAAGAVHLAWQSCRLNFRLAADARNPYVYAHTPRGVPELAERLERLARRAPAGRKMRINVVVPDNYWPLPWYLRRFDQSRVVYWTDPARWAKENRSVAAPELIFVGAEARPVVDAGLHARYNQQKLFALRPGVFVTLYVRQDLWPAFVAAAAP